MSLRIGKKIGKVAASPKELFHDINELGNPEIGRTEFRCKRFSCYFRRCCVLSVPANAQKIAKSANCKKLALFGV